ncbi:hypothetical protein, partial [Rhodopirellula bahusiensis]|uniref:hypothetical protein n=1 Tax=Rhodopirellula bahusiensis TaxID=2014065 RepID=UPI0032987AAC
WPPKPRPPQPATFQMHESRWSWNAGQFGACHVVDHCVFSSVTIGGEWFSLFPTQKWNELK